MFGRAISWLGARGPVFRAAAAFAIFLAAAVLVFALPVLPHLTTRCVASCVEDTKLYVWSMEWMRYAVSHRLDPLWSTYVWTPEGVNLTWVTTLPGPALVGTPITELFGPLATVNMWMILAPALGAWATYLVCTRVTHLFWPSVFGGAVFGFSTYMNQHMRAHLNLVLIFFVPLAAYLVLRRLDGSLGRVVFVVLLALVVVGQFGVSTELAATMALFGGIAFVLGLVFADRELRRRLLPTIGYTAVAFVTAGILVSPFLLKAFGTAPLTEFRPPELNSADLLSFVIPPATARFGGWRFHATSYTFPGPIYDASAYLSVAFIGVIVWFAIEAWRRRSTWFLLAFMASAAVLSLGPVLNIRGQPGIWMPQALIGKLPLIQHALPERFVQYMFLGLAVVVALFLAKARGAIGWIRYGLVVAGLALISVNLGRSDAYHATMVAPAFFTDGAVSQVLQPGETVLVIPNKLGDEMLWQADAGMAFKLARGYVGPVRPRGNPIADLGPLYNTPDAVPLSPDRLRAFLQARGVGAVIVSEPVQDPWRTLMDATLGPPAYQGDGVAVWDVPPVLPATPAPASAG